MAIAPHQRGKLERLCRYVSRPRIATERLALTASGQVRYALKTPYRDGTTHMVLEPLDLMARLAALVPPPRMHLTRCYGIFAPHSNLCAAVTPAHRGVGAAPPPTDPVRPPTPRHVALSWACRLKRVFGVEISGHRAGADSAAADAAGLGPVRAEIQVRGGAGRICARGREMHSAVGGPAGSPGRRACTERAGDGRLALTMRPVTQTRIGLDRWFEFPIRSAEQPGSNESKVRYRPVAEIRCVLR